MNSLASPKYGIGDWVKGFNYNDMPIIGAVVSVSWDTKISEWNMKCGAGYEDESENVDMWLYLINAVGHRKAVKLYEEDLEKL